MNIWNHQFSKNEPKNLKDSCPEVHRAEILQIFWVIFWKIDDFIYSFWLNLTFSISLKNRCFSRLYLTCPERVKSFIISQHITQKASRTVQISSWEIIFVTARALTMILQIFFDIWRWWAINFPDGQKYIFGMPVWSVIEELSLELE